MIEFILQNISWFWLALVVIFTLIEIFTMGLTTLWFALGAAIMIFLGRLPIPFAVQIFIFLIISIILLLLTRPILIKKMKIGNEKTNSDSLIGKKALVVKSISEFEKGEIKINGIIWSARTEDGSSIPENNQCEIVKIEGVTAIVKLIN